MSTTRPQLDLRDAHLATVSCSTNLRVWRPYVVAGFIVTDTSRGCQSLAHKRDIDDELERNVLVEIRAIGSWPQIPRVHVALEPYEVYASCTAVPPSQVDSCISALDGVGPLSASGRFEEPLTT